MPTVESVEAKIRKIERFRVRIQHPSGKDARGNLMLRWQYGYKIAMSGEKTVGAWIHDRFESSYEGYTAKVIGANGKPVAGHTKLRTVRGE